MSYVHPFWLRNDAYRVITPLDDRYPEGKDEMFNILRIVVGNRFVVELGCGDGRLAEGFSATKYCGYDPNKKHIELAKKNFPNHIFLHKDVAYTSGDDAVLLIWNVFMHVPDEEIGAIAQKLKFDRIVIGEVMDSKYRSAGNASPCFNRPREDYENLFPAMKPSVLRLWVKRYQDWFTVLCLDAKTSTKA